jgi:hypothetical protein
MKMYKTLLIILAVGITLGSTLLPGCSSTTTYTSSEITSMENELLNLIQQKTQIQGVSYTEVHAVTQVWITIGRTNYVVGIAVGRPQIEIGICDKNREVKAIAGDYGGLDGIVDNGYLSNKTSDQYTRNYKNIGLRNKIQKEYNGWLVKILNFFKQQ